MQKTIKKTIALLLTVVMLLSLGIPMVGAVEATTATYPTYAEAADGELLYKVDFNDKSRFNYDVKGSVAGSVTPSTDGTALTIKGDSNKFTVGGEIANLPLQNTVYTVDFSLTLGDRGSTTYFALDPTSNDGLMGSYAFYLRWDRNLQIENTFSNAQAKVAYSYLKEETLKK